jgi:hypothetical protein
VSLPRKAATRVELVVDSAFARRAPSPERCTSPPTSSHPRCRRSPSVLSTTREARLALALLILAGILTALLVTVWLRQRALRAQAYLPAARLVDDARTARKEIAREHDYPAEGSGGPDAFPRAAARLADILRELGKDKLESRGFIPPRLAPAVPPRDADTEYQEFLKDVAVQIATARLVAARGFRPVAARWTPDGDERVDRALKQLDAVAQEVSRIADELLGALGIARPEGLERDAEPPTMQAAVPRSPSPRRSRRSAARSCSRPRAWW